jgi:16S rRNA (uracil1498-N3)-methyltransferase
MNILILEAAEVGARIPRADRRWEHVKKILKKGPGDRIAAGLADQGQKALLGEAIVRELDDAGLLLDFEAFDGPAGLPPALAPLRIVLGFPRPIQAARILKDLTSLGIAEIHLTGTELGEKSYAQSSIFKDKDFRRPLIEGAEQAGNPRLPRVLTHWSLRRCLDALATGDSNGDRIYLHPYGDAELLGSSVAFGMGPANTPQGVLKAPVTLAIGSERGWTDGEIAALQEAGYVARSLGGRILKTETAAIAASVLVLAGLRML